MQPAGTHGDQGELTRCTWPCMPSTKGPTVAPSKNMMPRNAGAFNCHVLGGAAFPTCPFVPCARALVSLCLSLACFHRHRRPSRTPFWCDACSGRRQPCCLAALQPCCLAVKGPASGVEWHDLAECGLYVLKGRLQQGLSIGLSCRSLYVLKGRLLQGLSIGLTCRVI